jgi:hypothetical protein
LDGNVKQLEEEEEEEKEEAAKEFLILYLILKSLSLMIRKQNLNIASSKTAIFF